MAGNPRGRTPLDLRSIKEVERRADPKAMLAEAIIAASETSGRRRERVARRFGEHRRWLLERLDLDGPVSQLGAWQELVRDVTRLATTLKTTGPLVAQRRPSADE